MRISLIISFSMHFAVVAAAFFVLPEAEKFEVRKSEAVPAEIITNAEFAKLTAKPEDKKEEKPKPKPKKKPEPKKKEVKKPPPPPPEPPKPPEPKVEAPPLPKPPEPKVEAPPLPKPPEPEKKKAEAKPKSKPVPIPRVRPKFAKPKPKKKSKFDPKKVAALVNKLPEDKKETAQAAPEKSNSQFSGLEATISSSDKDLLRQKIGQCWNPPVGVKDAEKLIVKIKIRLKRDGSLSRPPQIVNSSSGIAADNALRAIRRCAPYDMFPPKKYNTWREIVLNFDPSEMFGG